MAEVVMSSKGQLVLPKAVRTRLCLKKGSRLEVRIQDGRVSLSPAPAKREGWRRWYGIIKGTTALEDHLREHREEVDAER